MSEFKFACPVCGQHMRCDVSQGGSVMDCPTCFQKIVAPQAPATADQKLILTGTRLTEKKIPARGAETMRGSRPGKIPIAPVIGLVIALAAGAAVWANRDRIFTPVKPVPPKAAGSTNSPPAQPIVAPPANDADWTLNLEGVETPASVAAGRIHGQDFIVERAAFVNGALVMRQGARGPLDFGVLIHFGGAQAESLSGKTIHVAADAQQAARVVLVWRNNLEIVKGIFTNGYALRLEFGPLANNRLTGRIYLCTPDSEKSYLRGTFSAAIVKPKPRPPVQSTPPRQ